MFWVGKGFVCIWVNAYSIAIVCDQMIFCQPSKNSFDFTLRLGKARLPFVQYIHVFVKTPELPREYCNVFQICIFLQSLRKKAKRETEGDHFQNGHGEGVVLMKPDDDKSFDDDDGTFDLLAYLTVYNRC